MTDLEETQRWLHLLRPTGDLRVDECRAVAAELAPILECVRQTISACQATDVAAAEAGLRAVAAAGMALQRALDAPPQEPIGPSRRSVAARKAWETRRVKQQLNR